jgi:hypothetical protein
MGLGSLLVGFVIGLMPLLWLYWRLRRATPGKRGLRGIEAKDTGDHSADVDRRMAYGAYDAAAAHLLNVLEKESRRSDLKAKLVEVYFIWGNADGLLSTVRRFASDLRGTEHWPKVVMMGQQLCPDEPMFQDSSKSVGQ